MFYFCVQIEKYFKLEKNNWKIKLIKLLNYSYNNNDRKKLKLTIIIKQKKKK